LTQRTAGRFKGGDTADDFWHGRVVAGMSFAADGAAHAARGRGGPQKGVHLAQLTAGGPR